MAPTQAHRIVIVGGGAGGLELATRLGRKLGQSGKARITLLDSSLLHVWKPLYHEVAAGTLDSQEDAINFLAQAFRSSFQFHYGRMVGLDRENKNVLLGPLIDDRNHEFASASHLPYDTLVICVGSTSNHFGIPGAREHCLHLETLQQAESFHRRLVRHILRIQIQPELRTPLHIAIIGGGATGVELAAELRSAARRAVHYGAGKFDPEKDMELSLVEAAPRLLPHLPAALAAKAEVQLRKINVNVLTGEQVSAVTADGIKMHSGHFLPAPIKVWAAGIKAPDWLSTIGLETKRNNRLLVRGTLQTTQDDAIFAFGDCAWTPQPGTDQPVPQRAQAAHQQASFLSKALRKHLAGAKIGQFTYHDHGSLVSLSDEHAVGRLMGNLFGSTGSLNIEGALARIAYNSLYQRHLMILFGPAQALVLWIAHRLTRPVRLRLKLH